MATRIRVQRASTLTAIQPDRASRIVVTTAEGVRATTFGDLEDVAVAAAEVAAEATAAAAVPALVEAANGPILAETEAARDQAQAAADTTTATVANAAVQRETLAALTTAMSAATEGALGIVYGLNDDEGVYRSDGAGALSRVSDTQRQIDARAAALEAIVAPFAVNELAEPILIIAAPNADGADREVMRVSADAMVTVAGLTAETIAGAAWDGMQNDLASVEVIVAQIDPAFAVSDALPPAFAVVAPDNDGGDRELLRLATDGMATVAGLTAETIAGAAWDAQGARITALETNDIDQETTYSLVTHAGGAVFVDPDGRMLGVAGLRNPDPVIADIEAASPPGRSFASRLAVAMSIEGHLLTSHWGLERLAMTRAKIARLKYASYGSTPGGTITDQLVISMAGDSNTYSSTFGRPYARMLRALLGSAGPGWITLVPVAHSVDDADGVTVAFTGTWASVNHTNPTPDTNYQQSSTAGHAVTVTFPDTVPLTDIEMHYVPTADGEARYRWNGGSWVTMDLTVGTGSAWIALTGIPSGTVTRALEVEVVSGTVRLSGLDPRVAANGVRINKLGQNGAQANSLAAVNAAAYQASLARLNTDLFIVRLATNDQGAGPSQIAEDLQTIVTNFRAATPGADVLLVMPPENHLGRAEQMADIAVAVRTMCARHRVPFLDLQFVFGDVVAEYDNASPRPWMPDGVHEDVLFGGPAVAEMIYRATMNAF